MAFQGESLEADFYNAQRNTTILINTKEYMHAKLSNVRFILSLSFLVDIFEFVNSINLSLQGREITVLHCHEKLKAYKMRLEL